MTSTKRKSAPTTAMVKGAQLKPYVHFNPGDTGCQTLSEYAEKRLIEGFRLFAGQEPGETVCKVFQMIGGLSQDAFADALNGTPYTAYRVPEGAPESYKELCEIVNLYTGDAYERGASGKPYDLEKFILSTRAEKGVAL